MIISIPLEKEKQNFIEHAILVKRLPKSQKNTGKRYLIVAQETHFIP